MRSRPGLTILLMVAVLVIPAILFAREGPLRVTAIRHPAAIHPPGGHGTAPAAPAAVLKTAGVAEHVPWFGLQVISGSAGLVEGGAPHQPPPPMRAAGGILIDVDTGVILWQQDAHAALPPASTTKILTALVALHNFDPQQLLSVTPAALDEAYDETVMGLVNGEKLTVEELLTGALLVSGNDAAKTLAVGTVGMDNYVAAMNAQVRALGLHDSHFVSPVGLDDPGQRASAYDLAALARTAVRTFPLFRRIVATPATTLPATPTHHQFVLTNLNQLLEAYPGAVGVKPGWTGAAGSCLVGMAVRDGHELISVVLNAPLPTTQTKRLLDWGFAEEADAAHGPR